jgi:hypothetical protein
MREPYYSLAINVGYLAIGCTVLAACSWIAFGVLAYLSKGDP